MTPQLFSHQASISDLFDLVRPWNHKVDANDRSGVALTTGKKGGAYIGHYLVGRDEGDHHFSAYVVPSPRVVAWIRENMLDVDYDSIFFEAIVRDGHARVFARYGQILGSRYLAEMAFTETERLLHIARGGADRRMGGSSLTSAIQSTASKIGGR